MKLSYAKILWNYNKNVSLYNIFEFIQGVRVNALIADS